MDADTKNILFNVIDTYIQNFKTKQAFVRRFKTHPEGLISSLKLLNILAL
jgi:hypothetical protein